MAQPFHLGWFTNFTQGDWTNPVSEGTGNWDGKFFVDMAQAMERACFDYIMLEDTLMVSEAFGGSSKLNLHSPKLSLRFCSHASLSPAAMYTPRRKPEPWRAIQSS